MWLLTGGVKLHHCVTHALLFAGQAAGYCGLSVLVEADEASRETWRVFRSVYQPSSCTARTYTHLIIGAHSGPVRGAVQQPLNNTLCISTEVHPVPRRYLLWQVHFGYTVFVLVMSCVGWIFLCAAATTWSLQQLGGVVLTVSACAQHKQTTRNWLEHQRHCVLLSLSPRHLLLHRGASSIMPFKNPVLNFAAPQVCGVLLVPSCSGMLVLHVVALASSGRG